MNKIDTPEALRVPSDQQIPALSILLVNWNTCEMTLECLRSIYDQTKAFDFEVIVLDNGSSDGSVEAIQREFPDLILIREQRNLGFARATNKQVHLARAPLILLLNTDTVILDHAIERLVKFSEEAADAGIWGGRTIFADGSLNATSCWRKITPWSAICFAIGLVTLFPRSRIFNPEAVRLSKPRNSRVNVVTGCFFLIRRSLWEALGGFDSEFFMYGEEADLCLRAAAIGVRPRVTADATIIHHGGASAARRADHVIYMLGARAGLMSRHFSPCWRWLGRISLQFGARLRVVAYVALATFSRTEAHRGLAQLWTEVMKRRTEWENGPPHMEL